MTGILVIVSTLYTSAQNMPIYTCMNRAIISAFETDKPLDSNGVILTKWQNGKPQYHPVHTAQYGVLAYNNFKETGDSIYYFKCINQAHYFKDTTLVHSMFDGKGIGLPYQFNFWDLKAPWYSGMAQGYSISYLLRYFDLTQDSIVLPIIQKLAFMMLQPQEEGGTLSKTPEGYTWIEEYPNSKKSPQVLNGYINSIIGLKEYIDFFPEDTFAVRIFHEAYEGLVNSFEYFDTPNWSNYNRSNRPLSHGYLQYEILEMLHLYEIFEDERFDKQMRIWSAMAYDKFDNNDKGLNKYPKYNYSALSKEIFKNKYGTSIGDSLMVAVSDTLPCQRYSTLKELNRELLNRKLFAGRNSFTGTFVSFRGMGELKTDYAEIILGRKDSMITVDLFKIEDRKLIPVPFASYRHEDKLILSFQELNLRDLVFLFDKGVDDDFAKFHFEFYNTTLIKQPFFIHRISGQTHLTCGEIYQVTLDRYNTDKVVIFYKFVRGKQQNRNAKWRVQDVVGEEFTPLETGYYQFLIVFDWDSPLSMIGNLGFKQKVPEMK